MPLVIFGIMTFLIGMILGLFFRVFVLIPVLIISFAAIAIVGFELAETLRVILLVACLGVTALQVGYVAGSLISVFAAESKARKKRSAIDAAVRRLARRTQT